MCNVVRLQNEESFKVIEGASCAFGVFDGYHLGHKYIIDAARSYAEEADCKNVVLTFDCDPDELFSQSLHKLMTNEERITALSNSGVDAVAVFEFNREFAAREPLEFLEYAFGGNLPKALHVGSDFRFGAFAKGDINTLTEWGTSHGVDVVGYDLLEIDGAPVTSTRIRELIEIGDKASAQRLLGHEFL